MTRNPVENRGSEHVGIQEQEDGFIKMGFYVSMALGVVVGFWGVFGTILLKRSWRFSYFKFLNIVKDKMYVTGVVNMVKFTKAASNIVGNTNCFSTMLIIIIMNIILILNTIIIFLFYSFFIHHFFFHDE